jgi:hypothetical protein
LTDGYIKNTEGRRRKTGGGGGWGGGGGRVDRCIHKEHGIRERSYVGILLLIWHVGILLLIISILVGPTCRSSVYWGSTGERNNKLARERHIRKKRRVRETYRFKARMIARGFEMEKGVDYVDNFSPMPDLAVACLMRRRILIMRRRILTCPYARSCCSLPHDVPCRCKRYETIWSCTKSISSKLSYKLINSTKASTACTSWILLLEVPRQANRWRISSKRSYGRSMSEAIKETLLAGYRLIGEREFCSLVLHSVTSTP